MNRTQVLPLLGYEAIQTMFRAAFAIRLNHHELIQRSAGGVMLARLHWHPGRALLYHPAALERGRLIEKSTG
jgi:hypothetical protein